MDKLIYILPIAMIVMAFLGGIILCFGQRFGTGPYWILVGLINFIVMFAIPKWG